MDILTVMVDSDAMSQWLSSSMYFMYNPRSTLTKQLDGPQCTHATKEGIELWSFQGPRLV